jgi:hypothetical protein
MDDNTVYARTGLGTQVARDPASELPRSLRTLLLSIDGRTKVRSYRTMLTHLGDIPTLLQALEGAGYVAATGAQTARQIAGTMATQTGVITATNNPQSQPRSAPQLQPQWQQTAQPRDPLPSAQGPNTLSPSQFEARVASNAAYSQPKQSTSDLVTRIQELQTQFTQRPTSIPIGQSGPGSGSATIIQTARLNSAKALMTDFLLRNLPDVAVEVSISIDRINTLSALESNLADYSQLIAPLGRISAEHLKQLRTLISGL